MPPPHIDDDEPAVVVRRLTFAYPGGTSVFRGLSLAIPAGARCLLLGANGVGKSTLLRLLAGRHMVDPGAVRVLGRAAFHDTTLAADVAFIGGGFPFAADIAVRDVLGARPGVDPARRARLLAMLDVDPAWRMHRVSDGQRRRVQLLLDLERRLRLILLDEVTAELDVLARADLLGFLRDESETGGVTVIYASHVLEGLQRFGTHLLFLSPSGQQAPGAGGARVRCLEPIGEVAELAAAGAAAEAAGTSPLAVLCERWMREDRRVTHEARSEARPWPRP
jgi:CCR4-NOT complex subunit CAF16